MLLETMQEGLKEFFNGLPNSYWPGVTHGTKNKASHYENLPMQYTEIFSVIFFLENL